jgi:hypothetical protein
MCTDVLKFGSSSVLGADSKKLCTVKNDSAKHSQKGLSCGGANGYLYAGKFDVSSLSLNVRAKGAYNGSSKKPANKSGFASRKMSGSGFLASSTGQRGPAAPAALQDRLQDIFSTFTKLPEQITYLTEQEESRRKLQELAALRQGRVLGDSRVFRQTFVIRSYEVGPDGRTSIDTIVSLFQVHLILIF